MIAVKGGKSVLQAMEAEGIEPTNMLKARAL